MTNKIALRTIEEFLADYRPTYNPVMPLLIGPNSVQYSVEEGKITFKRLTAEGDLRAKILSAKDTEMHNILAIEGSKNFKKYFLGAKYVQSQLQDTQGYENVLSQVLDENNKVQDIMLLGDSENNGIYTSTDANYTFKSSYEVQKATDGTHLADMYKKMVGILQDADEVDGRKLVMVYGSETIGNYNGLFAETSQPFSAVLQSAMPAVSFAKMPVAMTPNSAEGFLVLNLDQIKLHYTILPSIRAQGINEEDMYAWTNFLMGSCMVDVMNKDGIIRQPLTFEA